MTKLLKEPYPGISEEERKTMFTELSYDLRENKKTGDFYAVKKRQKKQTKKQKTRR